MPPLTQCIRRGQFFDILLVNRAIVLVANDISLHHSLFRATSCLD